jgi:hypothetical protein
MTKPKVQQLAIVCLQYNQTLLSIKITFSSEIQKWPGQNLAFLSK